MGGGGSGGGRETGKMRWWREGCVDCRGGRGEVEGGTRGGGEIERVGGELRGRR